MKKIYFISLSLILAACSGQEKSTDTPKQITEYEETPVIAYQPIPNGYGYMQQPEKLQQAVNKSDLAYIRNHAWKLWAGIMQPAKNLDWPVWYTWENTYGVFASDQITAKEKLQLKGQSLIQRNVHHTGGIILDTLENSLPLYKMPQQVIDTYRDSNVFTDNNYQTIGVGNRFLFNGDIMIPTESFSQAGYDWIRKDSLFLRSQLNKRYEAYKKSGADSLHSLDAPQEYIVTKHMYWPVSANGVSALPVWKEDYFPMDYRGYAGYETWTEMVGIDPSGEQVGDSAAVSFLYNVYENQIDSNKQIPTKHQTVKVHGLEDFYYHKVTQEDWDAFDATDKAIINAASYWAHNKPFTVGDYLVTIAMHVNTKEIPTWALQSAWWSNTPDKGKYAQNRPTDLPNTTVGPWDHYLLVDSYGVVDSVTKELPIAMNPYIELVIHPIATNCNNCHSRAGWPLAPFGQSVAGKASYQNPDCANLLEKLTPESTCLSEYLLTDFQWVIPDHVVHD